MIAGNSEKLPELALAYRDIREGGFGSLSHLEDESLSHIEYADLNYNEVVNTCQGSQENFSNNNDENVFPEQDRGEKENDL